jgi:hypothetical protein
MADLMSYDSRNGSFASIRPQPSRDSRSLARLFGAETGTVFGTVSFVDLEP